MGKRLEPEKFARRLPVDFADDATMRISHEAIYQALSRRNHQRPLQGRGHASRNFGCLQHLGFTDDELDHRLNSRTIYINPVFRFLYWNMNYHVEHHIFPLIPYHALPKLHEKIKAQCPTPYPNMIAAYREILPTLAWQFRDSTYFIKRELPMRRRCLKVVPRGIQPRHSALSGESK